jgi:hypothetical protein
MKQWILFQNEKFILIGGAIATEDQYINGYSSYAYLYKDGTIKRRGDVIGNRSDITILGSADDVKQNMVNALNNMIADMDAID